MKLPSRSYLYNQYLSVQALVIKTVDWPVVIILACLFLLSLAAASLISPPHTDFVREHIALFNFNDTNLQRHVYSFLLLSTFAVFISLGFLEIKFPVVRLNNKIVQVISALAVIAILYMAKKHYDHIFVRILALSAILWLFFKIKFSIRTNIAIGLSALGLFLLTIPAFFFPFYISPASFWAFDHHWSGIVGPALLAQSLPETAKTIAPQYGVIMNLLIGISDHMPLTGSYGCAVLMMQLINLGFAALIFIIAWQRGNTDNQKHRLTIALLVTGLLVSTFLGYASNWAQGVLTPNQLSMRFIMMFMTVATSPWILRQNNLCPSILSAAFSALCIFYNLEIGIVCTIGLGFALFLQLISKDLKTILANACVYVLTLCASLLVLTYIFLHHEQGANDFASLIGLFSSGYGGISLTFFVPFFLMTGHALYLFARRLKNIKGQQNDLQGAVMAAMILVLAPYIINRFAISNMWAPLCLYCLMLTPYIIWTDMRRFICIAIYILAFILPFHIVESFSFAKGIETLWLRHHRDSACLYGMAADQSMCDYLDEKSKALATVQKNQNAIWFSATTLTISKLSGVQPPFNFIDAFSYTRTNAEFNDLINRIHKRNPDIILIDRGNDPLCPYTTPDPVINWQLRLLAESGYTVADQTPYWRIARKK